MKVFTIDDPFGKHLGIAEAWFPKLIFRSENILSENYISLIQPLTRKILNNQSKKDTALNVDSTHLTDNLIAYREFNILIDEILSRVRGFAESLGYCSKTQMQNLHIANMWANSSSEGDFVFPHVHTNSDFSGVYYLEAPTNSTITFYDNIYNMSKETKNYTPLSAKYVQYPCTRNSMLLFRSNMLHGNERQPYGDKLVIAFNVSF